MRILNFKILLYIAQIAFQSKFILFKTFNSIQNQIILLF